MMLLSLSTILASGFVAALISGTVALWTSRRKIIIENVTQERTKWREKIRHINEEVQKAFSDNNQAKVQELRTELRLLLNPTDPLDIDIMTDLASLRTQDDFNRFSTKLSLLLKHDWERSKKEAYGFIFRWKRTKRLSYDEYLQITRPVVPDVDGVITNTEKLAARDVVGKRVLCPGCHDMVFEMWPKGWDAHAAFNCPGAQGDNEEERKANFRLRFSRLFLS